MLNRRKVDMMKYGIPTIKIERFLSENIITGSGGNGQFIQEVNTKINSMPQNGYKAWGESVNDLLQYN